MDYYLINILRKANKLFTNNRFGKIIVKKDNDKVNLSTNTMLDKFLREIVALSIILFAKIKEIMIRKSDTTNHGNYYLVINNNISISKLI